MTRKEIFNQITYYYLKLIKIDKISIKLFNKKNRDSRWIIKYSLWFIEKLYNNIKNIYNKEALRNSSLIKLMKKR